MSNITLKYIIEKLGPYKYDDCDFCYETKDIWRLSVKKNELGRFFWLTQGIITTSKVSLDICKDCFINELDFNHVLDFFKKTSGNKTGDCFVCHLFCNETIILNMNWNICLNCFQQAFNKRSDEKSICVLINKNQDVDIYELERVLKNISLNFLGKDYKYGEFENKIEQIKTFILVYTDDLELIRQIVRELEKFNIKYELKSKKELF